MTGTIDQLTGTIVTISTKTVYFPNIDIKVFNRKSEFPQSNFLRSLTEPEITRKIPFKLTYVEYDRIKDEMARMEHVDYNIDIKINIMNVDDIEDFANV